MLQVAGCPPYNFTAGEALHLGQLWVWLVGGCDPATKMATGWKIPKVASIRLYNLWIFMDTYGYLWISMDYVPTKTIHFVSFWIPQPCQLLPSAAQDHPLASPRREFVGSFPSHAMGVSTNGGYPKWMAYFMENPQSGNGWFGGYPCFRKPPYGNSRGWILINMHDISKMDEPHSHSPPCPNPPAAMLPPERKESAPHLGNPKVNCLVYNSRNSTPQFCDNPTAASDSCANFYWYCW